MRVPHLRRAWVAHHLPGTGFALSLIHSLRGARLTWNAVLERPMTNFIDQLTVVLFWFSVGSVLYAYFGYPFVIWWFARWSGRSQTLSPRDPVEWPAVSLVIAAH